MPTIRHRPVTFSEGTKGKVQVLEFMRKTSSAWARTPLIRTLSIGILQDAEIRNAPRSTLPTAMAGSLLSRVAQEIDFIPDVLGVETLQTPEATLKLGAGDCDDHAMLLASMFKSVGLRSRFVGSGLGGRLTHVYPEVFIGSQWIAADSTLPRPRLGARVPHDTFLRSGEV